MIEMTMTDFMILAVGLSIVLVGFLRLISKFRRDSTRRRHKRKIFYCNVCVKYFEDDSDEKYVVCPGCGRLIKRN